MQISPLLSLLAPKKVASAAALLTPTSLAYILALCVLTAGLAWFLQTASGNGMIFRPWRKLIFGLWWKGRPSRGICWPCKQRENRRCNVLACRDPEQPVQRCYRPAKWWRMLYKPLGGCVYCNGPWLLMPYFFGLTVGLLGWPWLLAVAVLPLAVGGQYAVIELLSGYAK